MTTDPRDPLGISGELIAEKYRVDHAVGEGGFSVVYKAEHTIWKQPVALKCFRVLANAPADQREQLLDGFIQEGKLMTTLSSRSAAIVQARDVGTFTTRDGAWVPFMVLEWLDGKPLDLVLAEETHAGLPPRQIHEAMALLEPAAIALDLVHGKNIAHRDVKPANIFVMGDPRAPGAFVKVLDFGIAKVMAEHAQMATALSYTGKQITAFTPNYGAPEQFSRTHGATGPWTDVFAMALILVEVLRGGAPALVGGDYLQLAVASRDPMRRPTPRTLGVPVSDAVEAVFRRALAVAPAERFATMGQFWTALHDAVVPGSPAWSPGSVAGSGTAPIPLQTPLDARAIGLTAPLGTPNATPIPGGAAVPSARPSQTGPGVASGVALATRSRALPIVLGLVGLAIAGGGGFVASRLLSADAAPPTSSSTVAPTDTIASAIATASATAERPTSCPGEMVLVPGGKFFMGSDERDLPLWQPAHKVTLDTFCIDRFEVTAGEYKECSDRGECKRPDPIPDYPKGQNTTEAEHEKNRKAYAELCTFGKPGLERHPINCVSWELADSYCKFRKKRLPTEAEWEYAARGSDGRKFPWGDDPGDHTYMNACGKECNAWEAKHGLKLSQRMYDADDGWPGTAPVGSFPNGKTKFGAYDVVGNVWEWTADWFETYKPDEVINPKGAPAGDKKAIRGGGFNGGFALWLNPAFRYHQLATASSPGIGFRCAMSL